MKILEDFKAFALRGNVIDMSVGIIIGASFNSIVSSLVDDIFMPILGVITNGVNYTNIFLVLKEGSTRGPYATLMDAKEAGATTLNVGVFMSAVLSFLVTAAVFFLLLRVISKLFKEPEKQKFIKETRQEKLLVEIRDAIRSQNTTD